MNHKSTLKPKNRRDYQKLWSIIGKAFPIIFLITIFLDPTGFILWMLFIITLFIALGNLTQHINDNREIRRKLESLTKTSLKDLLDEEEEKTSNLGETKSMEEVK